MKRFGFTCGVLLLAGTASAFDVPPSLVASPATITVIGSITEEFPPDTVDLALAVETHKETAEQAARENAEKIERVIAVLKGLVDQSAGDTVTTSSYSVQPAYEFDDKLRKSRLVGYRTSNQVTVRTMKLGAVGTMIDRALKSGATTVTDIRFSLKEIRKQCEGLLVKAAHRARSEADIVAGALGVRIDGVRHAVPSCGGEQRPAPVFRAMAAGKMMDTAETATPIEAGTLSLSAQVQVDFLLVK